MKLAEALLVNISFILLWRAGGNCLRSFRVAMVSAAHSDSGFEQPSIPAGLDSDASVQHSTALAAHLFGASTAVVGITEGPRRRVVARFGEGPEDAQPALSLCARVVETDGLRVVEDVSTDDPIGNHLDGNAPTIRFWAGVPVSGPEGQAIGALLVLDSEPHEPSDEQLQDLRRLAEMVSRTITLRGEAKMRTEAEEALQKSRQQYRTLVEQFPDGSVFFFNEDLEVTLAGGRGLDEVGLAPQDVEGTRPHELYPASIADEHEEHFRATLEGEERVYEQTYQGKHYRICTAPVRDADGKITAGLVVSQNVTECREAQHALQESKERLDRAQRIASFGYWERDLETGALYWSDELYRIVGWAPDGEVTLEAFIETVHPEDRGRLRAAQEAALQGTGIDIEYRIQRPSGEERILHEQGRLRRDGDGTPVSVAGTVRDVTEHRAAEQELRRTMNLLALAEEMAEVGGWAVDVSGTSPGEAEWTDKLYDLFELPRGEEPPVDEVFSYYHPDDRKQHMEVVKRAAEEGIGWDQELRLITAEGTERWVRNIGEPVIEDGEVVEIHGAVQNITGRKRREQELRAAKEEAEEASELKSAMLANMSHEIRTPLTSITGFTEVLKQNLDGELATFAEKAHVSSHRLLETLDSVLQLSKLEAGVQELTRSSVSLSAVVEETADLLRSRAEENAVALTTNGPTAPVVGAWNEGALNRIVGNLIENAIKFTPAGGRIEVRVREDEETAVLVVDDTGVGIEEAFQERMFEAFRQESVGVSREYEGSGLGLSIVQRLVEALGGEVTVESEKDVGTCFRVRLPRTGDVA